MLGTDAEQRENADTCARFRPNNPSPGRRGQLKNSSVLPLRLHHSVPMVSHLQLRGMRLPSQHCKRPELFLDPPRGAKSPPDTSLGAGDGCFGRSFASRVGGLHRGAGSVESNASDSGHDFGIVTWLGRPCLSGSAVQQRVGPVSVAALWLSSPRLTDASLRTPGIIG